MIEKHTIFMYSSVYAQYIFSFFIMTLQKNNPLHEVTLKRIVQELVDEKGWKYLAEKVQVRCFMFDPSLNSSLKFLRKTPWAREKVEKIWIDIIFNK